MTQEAKKEMGRGSRLLSFELFETIESATYLKTDLNLATTQSALFIASLRTA
jgi:hypothetical protein